MCSFPAHGTGTRSQVYGFVSCSLRLQVITRSDPPLLSPVGAVTARPPAPTRSAGPGTRGICDRGLVSSQPIPNVSAHNILVHRDPDLNSKATLPLSTLKTVLEQTEI